MNFHLEKYYQTQVFWYIYFSLATKKLFNSPFVSFICNKRWGKMTKEDRNQELNYNTHTYHEQKNTVFQTLLNIFCKFIHKFSQYCNIYVSVLKNTVE